MRALMRLMCMSTVRLEVFRLPGAARRTNS